MHDLSHAELIATVRAGEVAAYAVLWTRHHEAADRTARGASGFFDPDDLVQEAFLKVQAAITHGSGPRETFRAYLLTVVRNTAAEWGRRQVEFPDDDIVHRIGTYTPPHLDDSNDNRDAVVAAFRSLPARWQQILWHTEVEGLKPAAAAKIMGLSPAATSQLAFRAREGLRRSWHGRLA